MDITQLNISELIVERDHANRGIYTRMVYHDPDSRLYYKVWDPGYFYHEFFCLAHGKGFYDGVSLLSDTIVEDGKIVGYATIAGASVSHSTFDHAKYNDLVERLAAKCLQTGIVYIDFRMSNIVGKDGKYYIIDLEAAIPAERLGEISGIGETLIFNDYTYRKKIHSLTQQHDPLKKVQDHTNPGKLANFGQAEGRIFLEKEYLPTLHGRTLFVGVNYYTDFYHRLVHDTHLFETLDVSESVIEHGSPFGHYICDVRDFQNPGYLYDNIIMFGVLGHDDDWDIIKTEEGIRQAIQLLHGNLKEGGRLLLGPATVTCNTEFWDKIYNSPPLAGYQRQMLKKIGINYIWEGIK